MRATDIGSRDRDIRQLAAVSERLAKVQEQLASGKRISRASDDPAAAAAALGYRNGIAFETQMRRNIDQAISTLDMTDAALGSATESIQRLRELAISAATDTTGPDERAIIAREVDQLTQQLIQVANTNFAGEYLFAGRQTKTAAYAATGEPPTAVTYAGDGGTRALQVSAASSVEVNIPGTVAFGSIFDDLIAFRQALESGAPASDLQQGIAAMDRALDTVLAARSTAGSRTARLEATRYQSESTDLTLQDLQANVEFTDIAAAIVEMNAQQNALQATLGAIGRSAPMSLLDFLR